jgi:hypothetical protein
LKGLTVMNDLNALQWQTGKRCLSAALICALAFGLNACGEAKLGGTSAAVSANASVKAPTATAAAAPLPLPRACTLISDAEAATLLAQATSRADDSPENCLYMSAGSPGKITMLMVQPMQLSSIAEAESTFDALVNGLDGLNKVINDAAKERTKKSGVTIDGLGDAAWRSASNVALVGTQRLIARKGARILVVNITGMGKTDGLGERMEAFAKVAVAKL